jgi:hypothetical protein
MGGPFRPWEEEAFGAPDNPVVCVDFNDAVNFARWLKLQPHARPCLRGRKYMDRQLNLVLVPTQVWDFAAFGTQFPSFDRRTWLTGKIHDNCAAPASVSGAQERANRFGAIDLFGNVWEWTLRRRSSNVGDLGWALQDQQVRGGSFLEDLSKIDPILPAASMRDRARTKHSDLGFRIAANMNVKHLPSDVYTRLAFAPVIREPAPHVNIGGWRVVDAPVDPPVDPLPIEWSLVFPQQLDHVSQARPKISSGHNIIQ